jgi:hypothetical protein
LSNSRLLISARLCVRYSRLCVVRAVWLLLYRNKGLMIKFEESTNGLIDWNSVIANIIPKSGKHNLGKEQTKETMLAWKTANYNLAHIEWWNYYPGVHFDISIQTTFAKLVHSRPVEVFVSELHPGHCIPKHKIKNVNYNTELVRYVCFIDQPHFGNILIAEDECFHLVAQHSVYEWNQNIDSYAIANCGIRPQFLFHFIGDPRP